jgi:hypothetical protein
VPHAKYAMDYRPIDSFSMSYASRKVIFPGDGDESDDDSVGDGEYSTRSTESSRFCLSTFV